MIESLLLLLLAVGGGGGTPAASPALAPAAVPVTGVWRGSWHPADGRQSLPVEAVVAAGRQPGSLIAVLVSGTGHDRRTARLSGRYEADGAHLLLPTGGALRLTPDSNGRLIGDIKGGGAAAFIPGDGALELTRVRR
jgi:hypothetical protein